MDQICKYIINKLSIGKKKIGGRNNTGGITVRHKGGGAKQTYRYIDYDRKFKEELVGIIVGIHYDPNRSSHIASVCYSNKVCSLILAGKDLQVGDKVISGATLTGVKKISSSSELQYYSKNDFIHCVEKNLGGGGKFCRSAGTYAVKLSNHGSKVLLRLPSGEYRLFNKNCMGSYGIVSNKVHKLRVKLKAGYNRHCGIRPSVRGVAMNPVDHPHGGGEGKTSGGRPSVTKWCKVAKGKPTRKRKELDIVKNRKGKRNVS